MKYLCLNLTLVLLVFSSIARGQSQYDRRLWVYNGGYFLDLQDANKTWVEVIGGRTAYVFKEDHRDAETIILFHAGRNLRVFLHANHMGLETYGNEFKTGGWDNRRAMTGAFAEDPNVKIFARLQVETSGRLNITATMLKLRRSRFARYIVIVQ